MNTPFVRYLWKKLPFGPKVLSEIFQKRLLQALEGLSGVICVANDIMGIGQGDNLETANADQVQSLLFYRKGVKTKISSLTTRSRISKSRESVSWGTRSSTKGSALIKKKKKAVHDVPKPTDASGVRLFYGFVHYLTCSLPNLADDLKPLRKLTCDDVPWNWDQECD